MMLLFIILLVSISEQANGNTNPRKVFNEYQTETETNVPDEPGDAEAELLKFDEPTLIFTLIFCFLVSLIFVAMFSDRLFIETSNLPLLEVQELPMVRANLPFQVEFENLDKANLSDGVHMKIVTDEPVEVLSFWGSSCALLIHALNNEADSVLTEDLDLEHLDMGCQKFNPSEELVFHSHLKPSSDDLNFGPLPRLKYPLVIILRCLNTRESSEENHIVAGVWIIHVPDSIFTEPGHMVSNLVITNYGLVHNLQKMYMSSNESATSQPENLSQGFESPADLHSEPPVTGEGFDSLVDGQHDCTVCQNNPITRVILPCRHGCICEDCFKLVKKCPMCRGTIMSHFSLYPD